VGELRTARNHWAHPDPDHPFDADYALQVHQWVEELLRAVGAPEAEEAASLAHAVRWRAVRDSAAEEGRPEHQVLLDEVARLEAEQRALTAQLEQARAEASSAAGRSRAVARQLAELQTQYASVAGLRDDYAALRRQLDAERRTHEAEARDTTDLRHRLDRTADASMRLEGEAEALRGELDRTRAEMARLDPVETEAGRRWMWLVAGLIVVLAVLIGVLGAALR
jgi:chromosome segregation ATPase